jgi:hypothetical protein
MRKGAFLLVLLLALSALPAMARVGGGQSYGGGGGSHGGGGGGGNIFFLVELILRLLFYQPVLGIAIIIAIVLWFGWMSAHPGPTAYSSQAAPPPEAFDAAGPWGVATLIGVDPNFSQPLFMDFVQLLYVRFHNERAGRAPADGADDALQGGLSKLAPYFSPSLLAEAEADAKRRAIVKVSDVLIGSSHIASIHGTEPGAEEVRIDVAFESNFTEWTAQGALPPLYVTERWTFRRKAGVLSKGPGSITALTCPSCGSPSELRPDGTCPYCGRVVNQGDFQWVVVATRVTSSAPRPPVDLVGGGLFSRGYEAGTDLPTVYGADFETGRRTFLARNADFDLAAFLERVKTIFLALQQAWTTKKWMQARPYETDSLFNMHRYWMEMYEKQGLTNRLEDIAVSDIVPVKFGQDAFYDIITLRIYATMRDYTVDASGRPVSGDPRTPRPFSEYWSFIRRSTSSSKGPAKASGSCPNCGAPLEVNMAGECAYCNTKITSGEFDWVLSAIEQDEAYRG